MENMYTHLHLTIPIDKLLPPPLSTLSCYSQAKMLLSLLHTHSINRHSWILLLFATKSFVSHGFLVAGPINCVLLKNTTLQSLLCFNWISVVWISWTDNKNITPLPPCVLELKTYFVKYRCNVCQSIEKGIAIQDDRRIFFLWHIIKIILK